MEIALFDFDGTLTRRDTLLPFLRFVAGTAKLAAGMIWTAPQLAAYASGMLANDVAKEALLRRVIGGRQIGGLRMAGEEFARGIVPRLLDPVAVRWVTEHREAGRICVLVTASLDIYVEPWARAQGFDEVFCSRLAVVDGKVTGQLDGGNCYGEEKVRRVQSWLQGRMPRRVWAYGDSRGDVEMLCWADTAFYRGRSWDRRRV